MKKVTENHWYKIIFIFVILGCSGGKSQKNQVANSATAPAASTIRAEKTYYLNNSDNQAIGSINLDSPVYFRIDDISLRRISRDGKSKYRDPSNRNLYEVKYSDDGFKLRDGKGNLLWKLKYKPDKIKLSNNEEMNDAFDIKLKGETVLIARNNSPVDSLDLGSPSIPAVIKTQNRTLLISGPSKNPAFAIMTLSSIPEDQQMILITEVLLTGH